MNLVDDRGGGGWSRRRRRGETHKEGMTMNPGAGVKESPNPAVGKSSQGGTYKHTAVLQSLGGKFRAFGIGRLYKIKSASQGSS